MDTTANTETIAASEYITDSKADFDRWVDLGNPLSPPHGEIAGLNFTAAKGTNYNALALYKVDTCKPFLQSIMFLLEKKRLPVTTDLRGVEEQLCNCCKAGYISESEFTTALNLIKGLGGKIYVDPNGCKPPKS